jgi:hypothetical protein
LKIGRFHHHCHHGKNYDFGYGSDCDAGSEKNVFGCLTCPHADDGADYCYFFVCDGFDPPDDDCWNGVYCYRAFVSLLRFLSKMTEIGWFLDLLDHLFLPVVESSMPAVWYHDLVLKVSWGLPPLQ